MNGLAEHFCIRLACCRQGFEPEFDLAGFDQANTKCQSGQAVGRVNREHSFEQIRSLPEAAAVFHQARVVENRRRVIREARDCTGKEFGRPGALTPGGIGAAEMHQDFRKIRRECEAALQHSNGLVTTVELQEQAAVFEKRRWKRRLRGGRVIEPLQGLVLPSQMPQDHAELGFEYGSSMSLQRALKLINSRRTAPLQKERVAVKIGGTRIIGILCKCFRSYALGFLRAAALQGMRRLLQRGFASVWVFLRRRMRCHVHARQYVTTSLCT